jgi:hypothetical protein
MHLFFGSVRGGIRQGITTASYYGSQEPMVTDWEVELEDSGIEASESQCDRESKNPHSPSQVCYSTMICYITIEIYF